MADAVSHASEAQKLAPQVSSDHPNPSKFFTHFLYKAALVTVFLVLLPLFPSLAPEFVHQTLHARSWELLQLIFVGIAVSYGLFSKKNDETEKDHSSKLDNAQSYVSKLLQVSSVFDDESENQTVIDDNKIETWNSQYYRGEPVVVVAKESPVVGKEENGTLSSEISQKPLLLPVRSLKQRVSEPNEVDLAYVSSVRNGSVNPSSSNSCSKRSTFNSKSFNVQKLEGQLEENVVLRSPIPWRSRSGRMEMKENGEGSVPSILEDEPELNRVLESRSSRSFRPNSSPKNLSPSTSFSSESQAKAREDVVRKKTSSSPPPPPPPPPIHRKSMLMRSNSSVTNSAASSEMVLNRSIRSVPAEEPPRKMNSDSFRKSVRAFRSSDYETELVEKKALMETSDEESEDESEVDYVEESSGEAGADDNNSSVNDVGPDVDKKADEFIAKFREQIRLQRIESIRKSTAQRAGKSLR